MSRPSRQRFMERVLEYVAVKFPLVKMSRDAEPFSVRVNEHVASLENLYRLCGPGPVELRHQVDRWIVELLRAAEGSPDQNASFEQVKERILPMVLRTSRSAAQRSMITQPLLDGLVVAYVLDGDRTVSYIPQTVFKRWGISIEKLHSTAIDNLVGRSEEISVHAAQNPSGQTYLVVFHTLDGYDSSRLLLPTLHERLRPHLGPTFLAATPNRDILLCFRDEPAVVPCLRKQIDEDYRRRPHQVTDKVLLVTADGLAPHPKSADSV